MDQKRQTRYNFITNVITLLVNIAVGIFYTPYLVRSLGIMAYGVVPLALIINQYISVITGSITGSLTRFYSIALQQNNKADASKYLSSSFIAIFTIMLALSPGFALFVSNIDRVFSIPIEYVSSAKVLFTFTIMSFIVSLFASLFNITLYALNRLDLMNYVKIVRTVFKVVFTVLFFTTFNKDIVYIGYANFVTEALTIGLSIFLFVKTTEKGVKISLKNFDKTALVSVVSMSFWVIIHQIGDTGLYRTDNLLVNHFWGTKESGILGALSEFGTYMMSISLVFSSLFGPIILISYSNNDHDKVKKLALENSQLVGVIMGIMAGAIIGFYKPLIALWLGKGYEQYGVWLILKIVPLPLVAAASMFAFVYRSCNYVMKPAIYTIAAGIGNVLLSILICIQKNANTINHLIILNGVFIVAQSMGMNSFILKKLYPDIKIVSFLRIIFKIIISLIFTSICAYSFTIIVDIKTVNELILGMVLIASVGLIITPLLKINLFAFIMDYNEKNNRIAN